MSLIVFFLICLVAIGCLAVALAFLWLMEQEWSDWE